ncbi:MAG: hypothetical protein ABUT20_39400 [Bacteroidota bacterium]
MKKILLFFILLLFACSQTNEQKSAIAIKKFLQNVLNDPSSYEPVDFGKLDSLFLRDPSNNQKFFSGYSVVHSYRAKNAFGALVLSVDTFWIEKNYKWATNTWASKGKN